MDTTQWPQEIVVKPMEEIVVTNTCTSKPAAATTATMERKPRPQKEQVLNCPRCNSTNTKFCYYNNYSLTQPRYFCKTCRRYWTEGGSLRNIPVGGGSRKNRRPTSSSMISNNNSNTNTNNKMSKIPDLVHPPQIPNLRGQDLNLGFPGTQEFKTMSEFLQVPNIKGHIESSKGQVSSPSVHQHSSALELLNGSISRGLNPFTPMVHADQAAFYSSGFPMQDEFKPTLSFALEGSLGSRDPFPFEDLKQVSSPRKGEEGREAAGGGGDSSGYWTGMISGGSW